METKFHQLQAIILAGGFGTRLKSEVSDLPKCMAPVAGKPFIDHVLAYFQDAGIEKFIFALGYLHEIILDHLATNWPTLHFEYTIEEEALGTGGAIGLAASKISSPNFLVLNGDTLFKIDIEKLLHTHTTENAHITLALKPMENFDRYGTVSLDQEKKIVSFNEKQKCATGIINGGIYMIKTAQYQALQLPSKYSFEKDVLEKFVHSGVIFGETFTDYFIDIGIPEDFKKANIDLQ